MPHKTILKRRRNIQQASNGLFCFVIDFSDMKPHKKAFLAITGVLLIHAVLLMSGGYRIYQIDIPMHLLGGFAIGLLGLSIHHGVSTKYKTAHTPLWYHYVFVLGFVMLVSVAWEFHEYILDNTINLWYNFPLSQPSLGDTMKDFLNDGIGGSIAFFAFKKRL